MGGWGGGIPESELCADVNIPSIVSSVTSGQGKDDATIFRRLTKKCILTKIFRMPGFNDFKKAHLWGKPLHD